MLLSFSVLNEEQAVQLLTLMGIRTSHIEYMAVFLKKKKGAHIWRVSLQETYHLLLPQNLFLPMLFFQVVTPCRLVGRYQHFGET
jgi:hypothetical protein